MSAHASIVFRIEETQTKQVRALQRSSVLAATHISRGGNAHFVLSKTDETSREVLDSMHLSYTEITSAPGSEKDRLELLAIAKKRGASAIVIDGNCFQRHYLQKTASVIYTAVLDEQGQRALPVQLIINGSFSADENFYTCRADSTLLLGPKYRLLTTNHSDSPRPPSQLRETGVFRLLVGCSDEHETARILDAMPAPTQTTILCVPGPAQCPILTAAMRSACSRGFTIEHLSPQTLPQSLPYCDAALVSPDSSISQLAYYGIPTQMIASDDSQSREVHRMAEEEASLHIPPLCEVDDMELGNAISDFLADSSRLATFGTRLAALIDGRAAERILDCIAHANQPKLRLLHAA